MKLFPRFSLQMVAVVVCLSFLLCCKKSFQSGTGLYSVRQYHYYQVLSNGDTTKLADTKASSVSMPNNYLSWNGITFHVYASNDSLATYVHDTAAGTNYEILYYFQYYPKTDKIVVYNTTNVWRSF